MKNFNKQQGTYMLAKAHLEVLEDQHKKVDTDYIAKHNIVNPDGEIPIAIYEIDDEITFNKANADTTKLINDSGLWADILTAKKLLKDAEENLLQYGLNILPSKNLNEKQVLTKAVAENYTVRLKVIDLIMKLNTRTVKKAIHN